MNISTPTVKYGAKKIKTILGSSKTDMKSIQELPWEACTKEGGGNACVYRQVQLPLAHIGKPKI